MNRTTSLLALSALSLTGCVVGTDDADDTSSVTTIEAAFKPTPGDYYPTYLSSVSSPGPACSELALSSLAVKVTLTGTKSYDITLLDYPDHPEYGHKCSLTGKQANCGWNEDEIWDYRPDYDMVIDFDIITPATQEIWTSTTSFTENFMSRLTCVGADCKANGFDDQSGCTVGGRVEYKLAP